MKYFVFLNNLATTQFMPHGSCYLWQSNLVWLHASSELITAIAYYSIPITLAYFPWRREDLSFPKIFWLFAVFIILCGTTHVLESWTIWHPDYWLSGMVKALTALVSSYTAIKIIPLVSHALALPNPTQLKAINQQLEGEIAKNQQTANALRESEKRFRSAFKYAPIGMALVAPDGKWLQVNRSLCEIVGYSKKELLELTVRDITYAKDLELALEYKNQMLEGKIRNYQIEKRYIHKRGHLVWVLLSVSLVKDEHEKPLYFISQIQDIAARKQAELELRASEEHYRLMVKDRTELSIGFVCGSRIAMGIVELVGDDLVHISGNAASAKLFGLKLQNLPGSSFRETMNYSEIVDKWIDGCYHSQFKYKSTHFEYIHSFECEANYISVSISPVNFCDLLDKHDTSAGLRFSYVAEDITERKQAASLKQKQIRIKEIHHRVKNNLQVICSLLNLQTRTLQDQSTVEQLREIQNRVQSIALIHEKLYQSENVSRINLSEYICDLTHSLFRSYLITGKKSS